MKIGGLDIGTTGCKLTVFDEEGKQLGKAYRDYPVRRSVSGHETDVSVIMDSVYAVIREMSAQYGDIAGIGVTSYGETFVMTDKDGIPLHTAMLYTDPRGKEECAELAKKLDVSRQTVFRWESGNRVPDLVMCVKLAKILKIELSELVAE